MCRDVGAMDTGDTGCCHWWRCVTAMNSRPDQTRSRSRSVGWWRRRRPGDWHEAGTLALRHSMGRRGAMTPWHHDTPLTCSIQSHGSGSGATEELICWGEGRWKWSGLMLQWLGGHHGLGTNKHTNSEWAEIPNQWFALKSREMFCPEWSYVKTTLNIYLSWLI